MSSVFSISCIVATHGFEWKYSQNNWKQTGWVYGKRLHHCQFLSMAVELWLCFSPQWHSPLNAQSFTLEKKSKKVSSDFLSRQFYFYLPFLVKKSIKADRILGKYQKFHYEILGKYQKLPKFQNVRQKLLFWMLQDWL